MFVSDTYNSREFDKFRDNATGSTVAVVNPDGTNIGSSPTLPTGAATSANQVLEIAQLQTINSLVPSVYDYISLSYTGDNLTGVVFRSGGSDGTVVSTLTLAYTGSNLTSVTKT